MKLYGLVGATLSHSFSKKYFEQKFVRENRTDCQYDLFEMEDISMFRSFVEHHPNLQGVNVTIPYKKTIIPFLDALDEKAAKVGAVNTIQIWRQGTITTLIGHNTDVEGFQQSLRGKKMPDRALVLGTGGGASAIIYALQQKGIHCTMVSRTPRNDEISYAAVTPELLTQHRMVVNCTPVGMFPNMESLPLLPYESLTKEHFLYDLIYNPALTAFLKKGMQQGCSVQNGSEMLRLQAEASWKIWNLTEK